MAHPERWHEAVLGEYGDKEYEELPSAYRDKVAGFTNLAADRASRRQQGERIPEDEVDAIGSAENELMLPPIISAQLREVVDRIVSAGILHLFGAVRSELMPELRESMVRSGIPEQMLDRVALETAYAAVVRDRGIRIRQGLDELLTNAWKHGDTGDVRKQVIARHRIDPESSDLEVEVEDQGHGFDREELPDAIMMPVNNNHGRGLGIAEEYIGLIEYRLGGRLAVTRGNLKALMLRTFARHEEGKLYHAYLDLPKPVEQVAPDLSLQASEEATEAPSAPFGATAGEKVVHRLTKMAEVGSESLTR